MTVSDLIQKMPKDGWIMTDMEQIRRFNPSKDDYECPICSLEPNLIENSAGISNKVYFSGTCHRLSIPIKLAMIIARAADSQIDLSEEEESCRQLLIKELLNGAG